MEQQTQSPGPKVDALALGKDDDNSNEKNHNQNQTQTENKNEILAHSGTFSSKALNSSSSSLSSSSSFAVFSPVDGKVLSPTGGKVISLDYEEEGERNQGNESDISRRNFESGFETNSYGRPRRLSQNTVSNSTTANKDKKNKERHHRKPPESLSRTRENDHSEGDQQIDYIGLSNSHSSALSSSSINSTKGKPEEVLEVTSTSVFDKGVNEVLGSSNEMKLKRVENSQEFSASVSDPVISSRGSSNHDERKQTVGNSDNNIKEYENGSNSVEVEVHGKEKKDDRGTKSSTEEIMNPITKRRQELLIEARKKRIAWIEDGDVMWERENNQNDMNIDLLSVNINGEDEKNFNKYATESLSNYRKQNKKQKTQKKQKTKSILIQDIESTEEDVNSLLVESKTRSTTLHKQREKERQLKSRKKRAESNVYTKRVNIAEVVDRSIFGSIPVKTLEETKAKISKEVQMEGDMVDPKENERIPTNVADLLDRYMHFLNKIIDPNKPSDAIDVPVVQEDDAFLANDNPPLPTFNDLQLSLHLSLSLANKNHQLRQQQEQEQEQQWQEEDKTREGQNQEVRHSRTLFTPSYVYHPLTNISFPIQKNLYSGKNSSASMIYMPSKNPLIVESLLNYELFITRLKHPAAATVIRSVRNFLDNSIRSYVDFEKEYQRMKALKKHDIFLQKKSDDHPNEVNDAKDKQKKSVALNDGKNTSQGISSERTLDDSKSDEYKDSLDEEEEYENKPSFDMAQNIRDFINSMESEIKRSEIFGNNQENLNHLTNKKSNEPFQSKNQASPSFVKDCLECFIFSKLCGNLYLFDDSISYTKLASSHDSLQNQTLDIDGKDATIFSIFSPPSNGMIPYVLSLSNRSNAYRDYTSMTQCYLLRPDRKLKLWKKDRKLFARLHALSFLSATNLDVKVLLKLASSLRSSDSKDINQNNNIQEAISARKREEDCLAEAIACLKGIWNTPTRLHHLFLSPYQHEGKYILKLPPTNPLALTNTLITCMDLIEEGVERKKKFLYYILVLCALRKKMLLKHIFHSLDKQQNPFKTPTSTGKYSHQPRRSSMLLHRRQIYHNIFPLHIKSINEKLGADDIMPLLIVVILRANVPFLHTLFELVENYRDSSQIFKGRTGYVFTNFGSALQYLSEHLSAQTLVGINEDEYNNKYHENYHYTELAPHFEESKIRLQGLHSSNVSSGNNFIMLDSNIDRKLAQLQDASLSSNNQHIKYRKPSAEKISLEDADSEFDSVSEDSDSSSDEGSEDSLVGLYSVNQDLDVLRDEWNDVQLEKIRDKTKRQVQRQLRKLTKQEQKKVRRKRMESFNLMKKKKNSAKFLDTLPSSAPAHRFWQAITNNQQTPSVHADIKEIYKQLREPAINQRSIFENDTEVSANSSYGTTSTYKKTIHDIYRTYRFSVASKTKETNYDI